MTVSDSISCCTRRVDRQIEYIGLNYNEMIERLQENNNFDQTDCKDNLSEFKTTLDGQLGRFEGI